MRRMTNLALAMACVCSFTAATVYAGPACSGDKAKMAKSEGSCTKTCGGTTEGFPTMAMMVSGKSYDCCMSAAKAAKEAKTGIIFQVADQKFENKDKAMAALADVSEQYVENYMTVACVADGKVMLCKDKTSCCAEKAAKGATVSAKSEGTCAKGETKTAKAEGSACCKGGAKTTATVAKADGCCSKDGAKAKAVAMTKEEIETCCKNAKEVKYMVVGRTFKTHDEALKAREKTLDTVKTIAMTYVVDGKEVKCSTEVCPKAKADGKVVYVVNKEKMECEIEARIALAKAKFEAARDFAEKLAKI
ncbi:MAG: hypothetical protein AABZ08_11700 [Planctomycetota bacterium]